jgi:alkylation response protein AidB-like acyl-CoA dehydrogenase
MWNRAEPFDEAGRKGQTKQVDHVSSDPSGHSEFLVSRRSNPGGIFSSRSDECEREGRAMLRSQLVDCFDAVRREYVARIAGLAREKFAPRADGYDRAAAFPAEDFEDLFRAGVHAPCVPEAYGGLGLGPGSDTLVLWMMTKELARADMSLARCWEGHVNSQVLISALASEEQKERWFEGIVKRGDLWVAWSGEPQSRVPGQGSRFGTHLQKINGGYLLSGTKAYATSAGHARRAILLVNAEGPGGARHSSGSSGQLLLLGCDLDDPGVTFDGSWWNPIGMRATVSYLVRFNDVFIATEDVIGRPGQYLDEAWQTRFSPHYATTFLGGAEAAYEYALESIAKQELGDDPYVAHRIARMSLNVETANLWLRHVAELWDADRIEEAKIAGIRARYLVENLAMEILDHCVRACGARSLVKPSPVERIYRDLAIYVRHDNVDQMLATIGNQVLGRDHDGSFFRPRLR